MAHPMIPLRIIAAQMGMMTGTAMGDMRANWMIIQHTIAVRLPAMAVREIWGSSTEG